MSVLSVKVRGIPFSDASAFGPGHIFTLIEQGTAREKGFPVFEGSSSRHTSRFKERDNGVIEAVVSQNPSLPGLDGDTAFIVTGQQPGLLTGPLYTFLKAITVISMAETVTAATGRRTEALFWVASEDHDVDEVNRVNVRGQQFVHEYSGPRKRGKVPQVGDIPIEGVREPLLTFLRDTLPETEFSDRVKSMVAECDYSSYSSAFSGMMRQIFSEWNLYLTDPRALRPWTSPLMASLVEKWPEVYSALEKGAGKLEESGLERALDNPGIYEIAGGCRVPVDITPDGAVLSAGKVSLEVAAREIRSRPGEFSPGAALRPVLQDAVLPVACTVGGPGEMRYIWQIQELYKLAGVEPSKLFPRISATLVEEKTAKAAEKTGLSAEVFVRNPDRAQKELVDSADIAGLADWKDRVRDFTASIDAVAAETGNKGLERSRRTLKNQIEKFSNKIEEEALREQGLGRQRFEKVFNALMPHGKPQERSVNIIEFLNSHGPGLVGKLKEELNPFTLEHQLVTINTVKEDRQ